MLFSGKPIHSQTPLWGGLGDLPQNPQTSWAIKESPVDMASDSLKWAGTCLCSAPQVTLTCSQDRELPAYMQVNGVLSLQIQGEHMPGRPWHVCVIG